MSIRMPLAMSAAVSCWCVFAAETTVDVLSLTADQTVTIAAGDTQTVKRVTADGAWTLTKAGAGVLVLNDCDTNSIKIVVSAGTLEVRSRARPAVLDNAWFHVDASVASSLIADDQDGVRYVTQWHDVRSTSPRYASTSAANKPFVRGKYMNGRDVLDFGTVYHSRNKSGYGATLTWTAPCTHPEEIFAVIGDDAGAKAFVTGAGGAENRCNTFYANKTTQVAMRGNGSSGNPSELANGSSPFYTKASMQYVVDGTSQGDGRSYVVPDGMHLIDAYATKSTYLGSDSVECTVSDFANERNYCKGGIRIGEYIAFTNVLSAADRAAVTDYLESRWRRAFAVDQITVAEGAVLAMPDAGCITANVYSRQGDFTGTGHVQAGQYIGKTTVIDSLSLNADVVYNVAAGDTLVIKTVGGYGYQIAKTGLGKLVIGESTSAKVRVDVREGLLELGTAADSEVLGSVLGQAWFHVDATDAASLTTEVADGKTFVTTWADVRGEGHPSATVGHSYLGHKPYLLPDACAGWPVMDFGSLHNWASDVQTGLVGYGAAMDWSETCSRPVEVFAVIGDTPDAKNTIVSGWTGATGRPNTFFGYSSGYTGFRDDSPALGLLNWNAPLSALDKTCVVDRETVDPGAFAVPDGLHVIGLSITDSNYLSDPTKTAPLNTFAREREYCRGGLRIGEYVVFTNSLSAAERATVLSYLRCKWPHATFARVTAAAGTEVRVAEGTKVVVGILESNGATVSENLYPQATMGPAITVTEDVTDDPLADAPAWFHVDAAADTLSISTRHYYTNDEIVCWCDVRGRKAKNGVDYPGDAGVYAWFNGDKAFYNTNYLAGGMPVVDFGPIWRKNSSVPKRNLLWKQAGHTAAICETPYHFFVMVADNETAKDGVGGELSWPLRDQAFIGNSDACTQKPYPTGDPLVAYPVLGRANRTANGQPSPYFLNGSGFASSYGTGSMRLDGETVSAPGSTAFPEGLHLVSIDPHTASVEGGRCRCNAFANERGYLYGGQRLAEVLVCNQRLSAEKKAQIDALLLAKWKGGAGVLREADTASVAVGKTLTLKYQRLSVTNQLSLDGTIVAKSVTAPAAISVNSTNATVACALTIPATGTLTLGDVWKTARGRQKILAATSVSVAGGATPQWTVALPAGTRASEVRLSVESDGIYADFVPTGLILLVR